nr:MAG TPA: tail sheath protein [Caudoviricetes sp.]
MQDITFVRTNGNIPKTIAGQDHISGFLAYVTTLPSGFSETNRIQACSSIETAEKLGITSDEGTEWEIRVLHYHLNQIFRLNPGVSLYVGLFAKPTGENYTFSEIKTLQNYAGGSLRQVAVWCGHKELAAADLTALQGMATTLQEADRPLSILYAPKVASVTELETTLAGAGKCNVSVVIGQDGQGIAADLYTAEANADKVSVSGIGIALGILSKAAVHQSIAWVEKFPTGIELPAFGDGTLLRDLDTAIIESLDTARYLFFVTYDGFTDAYFNDSHTMDDATSDYAMIENVRTMDKAVRGIRKALLPKLGGSLYVDSDTGQLAAYEVEYLTTIASKPLEDMQKAGELSGLSVEIDPEQNVLSTSTLEIVIKQVPVGVLRRIRCKIGFSKSISE